MSHQAIPINVPQEAPFLRNNWKKVLGSAEDHMAKIRVRQGIASISNGRILLRSRLNVPDGFYTMTKNNQFRLITGSSFSVRFGGLYPDMDQFQPPMETMKPFCQIRQDAVRHLIDFCESAAVMDSMVLIDKEGCHYINQPKHPHFRFAFGVPAEIILDPSHLKLALIEMMRYDSVYLFREDWEHRSPLVLGHNWESCALVYLSRTYQG